MPTRRPQSDMARGHELVPHVNVAANRPQMDRSRRTAHTPANRARRRNPTTLAWTGMATLPSGAVRQRRGDAKRRQSNACTPAAIPQLSRGRARAPHVNYDTRIEVEGRRAVDVGLRTWPTTFPLPAFSLTTLPLGCFHDSPHLGNRAWPRSAADRGRHERYA